MLTIPDGKRPEIPLYFNDSGMFIEDNDSERIKHKEIVQGNALLFWKDQQAILLAAEHQSPAPGKKAIADYLFPGDDCMSSFIEDHSLQLRQYLYIL